MGCGVCGQRMMGEARPRRDVARHFARDYRLRWRISSARHTRLVEEEFDLAIRIAEAPEPTLVVRRIGVSTIIIVAAPTYLAARRSSRRTSRATACRHGPPADLEVRRVFETGMFGTAAARVGDMPISSIEFGLGVAFLSLLDVPFLTAFSPKKRCPFQFLPVIALATCERLR